MENNFIESVKKQFQYYRILGEKAMDQLEETDLFWEYDPESNSVAVIVKHLWGNMLSRWTDFLTTDGEKSWRDRDAEFVGDLRSREEILQKWQEGWQCLFQALEGLTDSELEQIVYIRNEGHTVMEAILRQLAHYAYHVGQIVYLARMISGKEWQSLSIPRNQSNAFNREKFARERSRRHFTDDELK